MKPVGVVKEFVERDIQDVKNVLVVYQRKDGRVGIKHNEMTFVESFGMLAVATQLLGEDLRDDSPS